MSKTIAALALIIAGYVGIADILTEAEIATFIDTLVQAIGILGVWYGRYTSNGEAIDILGFKHED